MQKSSYPNFSDSYPMQPQYDLAKWMKTFKDIHIQANFGIPEKDAVEHFTHNWDKKEKQAFANWMRYYQSGDYTKYKMAQQSYYVNDDLNYFLPNPLEPKNIPSPIKTLNDLKTSDIPKPLSSKEDKRKVIEDHRKKLLARLHSAEKLLSSDQGHMFAGEDFEKLLIAIYDLKKQVYNTNKMSLSNQTCVDLIIRQANLLAKQGCIVGSEFMVKLAQNVPGDFSFNLGDTPAGGSQPTGQGSLGNNTPAGQNLFTPPPKGMEEEEKDTPEEGVGGFLQNMEGAGITLFDDEDKNSTEDVNASEDEIVLDQDEIDLDKEILPANENDLVVKEAQELPNDAPIPKKEKPGTSKAPVPTVENVKSNVDLAPMKSDYDAIIDAAFKDLTVEDVVSKLESINNIFRNREISRQLAIVDIMLKKLDLNTFFPELGEASSKSLEMNSYCLTRIESAISRLRGAASSKELDLHTQNKNKNPQAAQVGKELANEEVKEQESQNIKKKIQDQKLLETQKPELEVESPAEEIGKAPAQIETPKPAPKPPVAPGV